MLKSLKQFYFWIGIHTAPPGTLVYSLHQTIHAVVRPFLSRPTAQPSVEAPPKVHSHVTIQTIDQSNLYDLPVRKIVIVKGDHIGDLLLAIPAIELLKKGFPDASLTLICNSWNESIAIAIGLFDKVVVAPLYTQAREVATPGMKAETSEILGALPPFDIAIDMRAESDTRWVLRHINSRIKVGFYADTMPQNNAIILPSVPGPQLQQLCNLHNREILCLLANAVITRFHLEKEDTTHAVLENVSRDHANKHLWNNHPGPIIGINTGAGRDIKCWPLSRYITLCHDLISRLDARIVIFGTRAESNDAAKIISACDPNKIDNMTGKLSLTGFTGAMPELDLFIGHDTGTTHIAASVGRPTLCLFPGVSSYDRFAPKGDKVTVIRSHIPCSSCGLTAIKECSYDHACMTGIAVDDVLKTVIRILGRRPTLVSVPHPGEAHEIKKEVTK